MRWTGREVGEFLLQPLVEQRAVRQIGERVIMSKMRDLLLGAPALGDVLVGRDPAAVGKRLVDDLHPPAIRGLDDGDLLAADVAQRRGDVLMDVADERSGVPADAREFRRRWRRA